MDYDPTVRTRPAWRAALHEFRPLLGLLIALLVVDGVLLVANGFYYLVHAHYGPRILASLFQSDMWDGGRDGTLIEWAGYIQLGTASIVLMVFAIRRKLPLYLAWSLVFLVLMLDDSLRLHENIGHFLVRTAHVPAVLDLRPNDVGELISWAFFGTVLGTMLVITHLRSSTAARRDSWIFFGLTVILACFAVVLDMLEIAVWDLLPLIGHGLITLTETAGELVAMTFILARVLYLVRKQMVVAVPRLETVVATPVARSKARISG